MRRFMAAVAAALVSYALSSPIASAHHSLAAYDDGVVQTVTGTVALFEWINPHIRIHIRAEGSAGESTALVFEGGDIGRLTRLGWRADVFHAGEMVSVSYNPFRNGAPGGHFLEITDADGEIYSLIRFRRSEAPAISPALSEAAP
ncbi:MAG: hypothetical protein RJB62_565 [Pseudomonadota bacterium]|jgi:hypothetical protein